MLDINKFLDIFKKTEKSIYLILGNEGIGINKKIISNSDYFLTIPALNSNMNSLNVSVVCGIILSFLRNDSWMLRN